MSISTMETNLTDLSNLLINAVDGVSAHVVSIDARSRGGATGVVWRPGIVVTADHVLERDDKIKVESMDGRQLDAKVSGRDATTDLAILSLANEEPGSTGIESEPPKLGQLVLAVGRPSTVGLSVSFGVVSSVGPPWRTRSGGRIDQLVRPDLVLYPGFSGGPLIDVGGKVIGLNTSGLTRGAPVTIPTETIERIVNRLIKRGTLSRGYLGLRMQSVELPETVRSDINLKSSTALLIIGIEPGGPAAEAELLVGDILLSIQGNEVTDPEVVQAILDPETIGTALELEVLRGGSPIHLKLTVSERPTAVGRKRAHRE